MCEQFRYIAKHLTAAYVVFSIIVVLLLSFCKYQSGEINYRNSNATWHVLYTIQAYEETPVSVHKFLPIVSFGNPDDKGIPWATAIPDDAGNYYYTSFPWLGYFLPWAFIKLLNLPITESSLYLFNSLLFALSVAFWLCLIGTFYDKNKHKKIILPIAMMSVVFAPEVMHGMGIVYWHQSVLQATLPAQMLAYYLWKANGSKHAKLSFYLLVFFNPLIEWTGYIANFGYVLVEYLKNRKSDNISYRKCICWIAALTIISFVAYSIHHLMVIPADRYISTLYHRFVARSVNGDAMMLGVYRTDLFSGYIRSYFAWWLVILCFFVWDLIQNGAIEFRHKYELLFLAFLGFENVLMEQHAILYSYDRMKMVFFVSFITCELLDQLLERTSNAIRVCTVMFPMSVICCVMNYRNYTETKDYVWNVNYRTFNQTLADHINKNYPDSILGTKAIARGYVNLLFHRGLYDYKDYETIKETAIRKQKRYAVMLYFDGSSGWELYHLKLDTSSINWLMYRLRSAEIYDTLTGETISLYISNTGEIIQVPGSGNKEASESKMLEEDT